MTRQSFSTPTHDTLEWGALLERLSQQAHSETGMAQCRHLSFEPHVESSQTSLQETAEMRVLLEEDSFPALAFQDLRGVLSRAEKGATLDSSDLRDLSVILGLTNDVRRCLHRHQDTAPSLSDYIAPLENLSTLKTTLDRCIDPEGRLLEHASPVLHQAIQEVKDLKQRIRHRLESILVSKRYEDILQERYFAQREGRYVIPVKVEMQYRIPGIVHDVSASGVTVFFEPRELVDLNNHIKVAEIHVTREANRILHELSGFVGSQVRSLAHHLEVLTTLDVISAKARLSRMLNGCPVTLNERGLIHLRQARHPLLTLTKEQVVPNDILFTEEQQVMVISGPNTGGKTVTLKLLGLYALMVRSGLQPPCAEGSVMGFFSDVYADIGDSQDLTRDLSSFSAHITKIIAFLETVSPRPSHSFPTTLVLLDEVVSSTDPAEGAALAEALLHRLAVLKLKVVVTTHYNALKTLAMTTPGFINASLEFNVQILTPTYRLVQGIPGGSSAIEIAQRLGMDRNIVTHALELLHQEDRQLEQILQDLHSLRARLHEEAAQAEEQRQVASRAAAEAKELTEHLRATEREAQKKTKKKFTEELSRARAKIQVVLEELQKERSISKVKEAKRRITAIQAEAQDGSLSSRVSIPVDQLQMGDRVEIVDLGTTGVLLDPPQHRKRVRIQVGESEMSVSVSQLIGRGSQDLTEPDHTISKKSPWAPQSSPMTTFAQQSTGTFSNTVDLRGHTADEAVPKVVAALDQAVLEGRTTLCLIHGHGSGKLKTVVREYLSTSPYVGHSRPGTHGEGGDGVTMVTLK